MKIVLSSVLTFLAVILLVQCVPRNEETVESGTTKPIITDHEPPAVSTDETIAISTTPMESVSDTSTESVTETTVSETEPMETQASSETEPVDDSKLYLGDNFGICREDVVAELEAHEEDDFYLTTPYQAGNWRSPNGDPSYNGKPGMNCGGFVGYVMKQAGMNLSAFDKAIQTNVHWFSWIRHSADAWYTYIKMYPVEAYCFADKEELLASGLAQKGDIILAWYSYNSTNKRDNHIGFFWGDRPYEDLMWHSSRNAGNAIGPLTAASPKCVWYLIPVSG